MTKSKMTKSLWPWPLFAAMLASAGLPIYIHAPKFFVDEYGVSLAALGGVLALLRLIDVVQDPVLGWLAQRYAHRRAGLVLGSCAVMAAAMLALFVWPAPIAPLAWFALVLTALFSAYSLLTILFYAQGVTYAQSMRGQGHTRLAGWREMGALVGVSLAAAAPTVAAQFSPAPLTWFALGFSALTIVAAFAMQGQWHHDPQAAVTTPATAMGDFFAAFRPALGDPMARQLLILALVNAAPVAVTSTLFLFFVESRLALPDWSGLYLLSFFLAAALSSPIWSQLAARFGEKRTLQGGMVLSIASFLWAVTLGAGDGVAFAVICLASGAALGADMVLLPALFARRMAALGSAAAGFGLWSFVSKLSLALAAAVLLPTLQAFGFRAGAENAPFALWTLSLAYAGLPCALKLIALAWLARMDLAGIEHKGLPHAG